MIRNEEVVEVNNENIREVLGVDNVPLSVDEKIDELFYCEKYVDFKDLQEYELFVSRELGDGKI